LVETPDEVVTPAPTQCEHCQTTLEGVASHAEERRQMVELPPVHVHVRAHRAAHVRCPGCGRVMVAAFPAEVPSRIPYGPRLSAVVVSLVDHQLVPYARVRDLLADLFGQSLWGGQGGEHGAAVHQGARPLEETLKAQAQAAPGLHHDETGVRVAGKVHWVQVRSTATLTHYGVHPKRGREATRRAGDSAPVYRRQRP
jgi:transposase